MKLYNSLIDRLSTQHETIEIIISGIDADRIYKRPAGNKWNIHDNISHLARYQPIYVERLNRILSEDCPAFERYKAEDDPEFEKWLNMDTSDLIKQIKIDRTEIYNLIIDLSEKATDRTGIHPRFGKLDILGWTEFFLLHEAHHLFTIFQLANQPEGF